MRIYFHEKKATMYFFATTFLFLPLLVNSCELLKSSDHFKIELSVKTSNCSFAGTDALILLHLPLNGNTSYMFQPNLGPFQIHSDRNNLENDQISNQTISWEHIKAVAGDKSICWPSLDTVIIERQRYAWVIPEIGSAWKPLSIRIKLNGTRNAEVLHEFAPNCDAGWISDSGFYQIGPAHNQIQLLSRTKEDVFV